ncbi:hypothetical protein X766_21730 [Mesorhizobium sp. LSJC255A00]|uniref:response regulator receiver domain n=1 Tax=Mesorhizobium sp. LSJC255A00 TaxID=1287313 RepID=UPI0003CF3232|nr:response regulator receiver domain [Mesorhizobium sp. LSJC255A00]ESX16670.1 hypothetical protein X766_21730 [Mesorhizobium sp. LSJC255A00]
MTDAGAAVAGGVTFSMLVKEAFIDPIRSVLIIDDQYPTWEQIFGEEGYDSKDVTGRWAAKSEILKVVKQFRKVSPALTVDIHDGVHNEEIGSYLHQSDLLVLDYQLEQEGPQGIRAAAIIADLLKNNHFNLVVIHTAIGDLIEPFNTILMSLLTPVGIAEQRVVEGLGLVEAFEDSEQNDFGDVVEAIKSTATASDYIAYRQWRDNGLKPFNFFIEATEMEKFRGIADKAGWDTTARGKVFDWAMSFHDRRVAEFDAAARDLRWTIPTEDKRPWIRTNGGFIAFADKKNTELLSILQAAIEDWKPSPSRLISSKTRAEISAQGAAAEDTALSDRHAYWQYYQELRKKPLEGSAGLAKNHRKTLLEAHTARHSERLLDLIGTNAVAFGLKVLESDPTESDAAAVGFAAHYNVHAGHAKERSKALDHYNAHISTKPVSGWHLQPGHIFKVGQEMWVCVSPACDMVPMQKTSAAVRESSTASTKPFIAVKLHPPTEKITPAEVNSNTMVFLKEKSGKNLTIKSYSIYPKQGEFGSPIWRLFMAADFGKIDIKEDRTADLQLSYLCGKQNSMKIESCKAQIIGQLRYEYALNLIQKLGVEFTRIGLDFSPPAE